MPDVSSDPHFFVGEFRHGIDPKNRITIPADWRTNEAQPFYVRIDSTNSTLQVMPPAVFEKTVQEISQLQELNQKERREAARFFSARSQRCNADKLGRMVLPPEFCAAVGLSGEIVLVGDFQQFEIMTPEVRAARAATESASYLNAANRLGL